MIWLSHDPSTHGTHEMAGKEEVHGFPKPSETKWLGIDSWPLVNTTHTHTHPHLHTHTYCIISVFYSKEKDSSNQPHLTVSVGDLQNKSVEENVDKDLVYSLNDRPPWYMCILLGFQVTWDMDDDATQAFTLVYSPFWCCKPPAFRTVRKFTSRLRLEPENQVTPTRVGKK